MSEYDLTARSPGIDRDYFASSRADMLLDLFRGGDKPSLPARGLLPRGLRLLSDGRLPIGYFERVIHDERLRSRLVKQCTSPHVREYFERQFPALPKATPESLIRRIDALLNTSESVRLALSGTTVPDFTRLQDEGAIIEINCFGKDISQSVRELLQGIVFFDICQSVFRRERRERPFVWFIDESMNLFQHPHLRELATDMVCLSRSFGTFFCFIVQETAESA